MAATKYKQLYNFIAALRIIQRRKGGSLPIVTKNVSAWKVETTNGGETDYLVWPQQDYNIEKMLWLLLGQASQKNLPWPLGDGAGTAATLDRLSPVNYPDEQIPLQQLNVTLARVATVNEAISGLDNGLKMMDPAYPVNQWEKPMLIAGSVGVLLAAYFFLRPKHVQ